MSSPVFGLWHRQTPWRVLIVATAIIAGMGAVALGSWSSAALIALALAALIALPTLRASMEIRLAAFFVLWSLSDFAKKVTFLAEGQAVWSQYFVFLLPYAFFALAILIPWAARQDWAHPSRLQVALLLYVGLALASTWLSGDTGPVAKAAASGLMIAPWMMVGVGASHPEARPRVARVLFVLGSLSASYGILQSLAGPTPIELGWASASGEVSIGASHLTDVLQGKSYAIVWRSTGFQADEFTYGLFLVTALASGWMLLAEERLRRAPFILGSILILTGAALSLVRTTWVAIAALVVFAILARRVRFLLRPGWILAAIVGSFFAADAAALLLRQLAYLAAGIGNLALRRALTFGTLSARAGAVAKLIDLLPDRWLTGVGYGASPWIAHKFGGFALLPSNFASHNVVLEHMWYVGLVGVVLASTIVYLAVLRGYLAYLHGALSLPVYSILLGYLLAMVLTGLSIGGVFLSFPYFFYLGALGGKTRGGHQFLPGTLPAGERM